MKGRPLPDLPSYANSDSIRKFDDSFYLLMQIFAI